MEATPMYTAQEREAIAFSLVGLVIYVAVAWAVAEWTDGGQKTFWIALGIILAARLFFGVVEGVSSYIYWRLRGKQSAIDGFLRSLRGHDFPRRYYDHDDFLGYLCRVRDDPAVPPETKWEARAMEAMLAMFENAGILSGVRWHAASEIAFEAYSPRSQAPKFEVPA
jgi:hypothetical protein